MKELNETDIELTEELIASIVKRITTHVVYSSKLAFSNYIVDKRQVSTYSLNQEFPK